MKATDILDSANTAAAAAKVKPAAALQTAQELLNILLGAGIVAASFAALTAKLDADSGVTDTNYGSTLNPATDLNALAQFNSLLAKLDADAGVTDTDFVSKLTAAPDTLYTQFVALLAKLDADATVNGTNYGSTVPVASYPALLLTPLNG